jgi:hypothetical protein
MSAFLWLVALLFSSVTSPTQRSLFLVGKESDVITGISLVVLGWMVGQSVVDVMSHMLVDFTSSLARQ